MLLKQNEEGESLIWEEKENKKPFGEKILKFICFDSPIVLYYVFSCI